jgi:hypothetical protein
VLRSFERFFRVKNQPLSEKETRCSLRQLVGGAGLVDNILLRTVQLCTSILTEEQVNQARFGQCSRPTSRRTTSRDPYVEKLLRQSTPEAALTLLRESLEDLHQLLRDMVKLSRLPFASFNAVGKILYREIRRSHLLAMLLDKKFKPVHDHIRIPAIAAAIRVIENPLQRRQAAKVFLELFRPTLPESPTPAVPRGQPQERDPLSLITRRRACCWATEQRVLRRWIPIARCTRSTTLRVQPARAEEVISTELMDIRDAADGDHPHAGGEQPRHPEGLLPAVRGAAGHALRVQHRRPRHLPRLHRPPGALHPPARPPGLGGHDGAHVPGPQGRRHGGGHEGGHLEVLRHGHEVPHVPRLVGLRAVLHRDPKAAACPPCCRSATASRRSW